MRFIRAPIRSSWLILLAAAVVLAWTTAADAQRNRKTPQQVAAAKFHAGQKVEFDHFGKPWTGEVVSIDPWGMVKVRFQDNGVDQTWDYGFSRATPMGPVDCDPPKWTDAPHGVRFFPIEY